MRITILHNTVDEGVVDDVRGNAGRPDERDVLVQINAVRNALSQSSHQIDVLPCMLDLETVRLELGRRSPHLVFNLVEALGGSDWLMFLATGLLEALRVPFTGSGSSAIVASGDKLLAKQRLRRAGLPTADWFSLQSSLAPRQGTDRPQPNDLPSDLLGEQVILKATREHASIGLGDDSVFQVSSIAELSDRLRCAEEQTGRSFFAERFIPGREFNISLLEIRGQVRVLPCAEIDFSAFPTNRPRLVGYRAKWVEDSFEYQATPRRFHFSAADQELLATLSSLARQSWDLFGLSGYARVDFRVDASGDCWILEANANPCLSPDAGFAAALNYGEITYAEAMEAIVESGWARSSVRDCIRDQTQ